MMFKFRRDDRRTYCHQVASLTAIVFVGFVAEGYAAPTAAGGYHVGLDFITSSRSVAGFGGLDGNNQVDDVFHPLQITDPASNAVVQGGLIGWTEVAAQRAVVLTIEDAYRAVETGDPTTTLAVQIHEGALAGGIPGRRLNVVFGSNASVSSSDVGFASFGAAFSLGSPPNGESAAVILLDHLDQLPGLQFTTADQVINNVAGTAAHEIGHLFGLAHVPAGAHQPYEIMATGSTGLSLPGRLTVRRFGTTPVTQAGGHSSTSLLLSGMGTVAKTDFNMDGGTTVSGDGSLLLGNLGRTDALFQEGDTNGDHRVDVSLDGFMLLRSLADDSVGSGVAEAKYDPMSGQILVSSDGVSAIEFISLTGSFLTDNATATNASELDNAFGDVPIATTINYATFGALGVGGVLDNFSIGAVLPIGISDLSTLQLRYLSGASEVFTGITLLPIPEPTAFSLLNIGLAGLLLHHFRDSGSVKRSRTFDVTSAQQRRTRINDLRG
jgi:hypothetical protein